jgi:hypothetical protein
MNRALKIVAVNVLVFLGLLLMLEASLQLIALVRPSYEVLFLQPDRVLGWKQVPSLRWTWAGFDWFASDFSVSVETNPLGFRDAAREFSKANGVRRVALLGDSFIEAVQVPFERTAGQRLERALNMRPGGKAGGTDRWEVLNFGISNYGIGQYLLTWREYARPYQPDFVAIFVAKFIMNRTVQRYEHGAFPATIEKALWIRPTFRVENDKLISEPAADFDAFLNAQDVLIKTEFAGERSRRRKQLIIPYYAAQLRDDAYRLVRRIVPASTTITPAAAAPLGADGRLLMINLKIIEKLGQEVAGTGGKLILLDATRYFGDDETVSRALKAVSNKNNLAYIPIDQNLLMANRAGISTSWPHDGHFNDAGNEILCSALFDWIAQNAGTIQRGTSPCRN